MKDLKFGSKVVVDKILKRRIKRKRSDTPNKYTGEHRHFDYKYWREYAIKEKECLFIGYRNLANGESDYIGDGVVNFIAHDYIKVALVVANERENPFYVPLESVLEQQQ